jgi:RNA polymerase sigma-70 factor, ECF subfamily
MSGCCTMNQAEALPPLPRMQFEHLALAELDSLYRLARRLTREPSRAEDLVQETFVRALTNRDGFDLFGFGIKPWLMRILYNVHLNRISREKRFPATLTDAATHPSQDAIQTKRLPLNPDSLDAMSEEVVRALDHLGVEYRTIILLWAVEELSYKEIAAILKIPMGTVMSRLHRARCKLAAELHGFASRERFIKK